MCMSRGVKNFIRSIDFENIPQTFISSSSSSISPLHSYVVFRIWITGIDMEKMEIPLNDTVIFSLSNFAFLRWWIVSSLEAFEAFSLFCFSTNDYICSKFQPFNIVLSLFTNYFTLHSLVLSFSFTLPIILCDLWWKSDVENGIIVSLVSVYRTNSTTQWTVKSK